MHSWKHNGFVEILVGPSTITLSTLVNSSFILKVNYYYLEIQVAQVENGTPISKSMSSIGLSCNINT